MRQTAVESSSLPPANNSSSSTNNSRTTPNAVSPASPDEQEPQHAPPVQAPQPPVSRAPRPARPARSAMLKPPFPSSLLKGDPYALSRLLSRASAWQRPSQPSRRLRLVVTGQLNKRIASSRGGCSLPISRAPQRRGDELRPHAPREPDRSIASPIRLHDRSWHG